VWFKLIVLDKYSLSASRKASQETKALAGASVVEMGKQKVYLWTALWWSSLQKTETL